MAKFRRKSTRMGVPNVGPVSGLSDLIESAEGVLTTPRAQLAKYYGGPYGVDDAAINAYLAAQANTRNMAGTGFRKDFPEPSLGGLNDQMNAVLADAPLVEDPMFSQQVVNPHNIDDEGFVSSGPGEGMPALITQPSDATIMVNDTPPDMPETQDGRLGSMDDAWLRNTIEQGVTDHLTNPAGLERNQPTQSLVSTDDAADFLSREGILPDEVLSERREVPDALTRVPMRPEFQHAADLVSESTNPQSIDRALAQIRRTMGGGETTMTYGVAQQLLDRATGGSVPGVRAGMTTGGLSPAQALESLHPESGLPLRSHVGLQAMTPRQRQLAILRLTELLGVGGAAVGTGMASGSGRPVQQDARYTMGPLGGLMD